MTAPLTLGSLFDGIGGFPLAGVRQGFTPVWASEIEPFPMEVTKIRFPDMLPVGDIMPICLRLSAMQKRIMKQKERS